MDNDMLLAWVFICLTLLFALSADRAWNLGYGLSALFSAIMALGNFLLFLNLGCSFLRF